MASLNDAYNELLAINAKLNVLHADNGQLLAGQVAIRTAINAGTAATKEVKDAVDAGTVVLKAIEQGQEVTNTILLHLSHQTDTMICSLEAIARHTCGILNEVHRQTGIQTGIAAADAALLDIAKTVNPDAALDLARRMALQAAQEACCPPPVEAPICNDKPCPAPQPLPERKPGTVKKGGARK